jgi:transposase
MDPMRRHEITDDDWDRIKDFLPGQAGDPGVTAKDNRLFVNAVLWIARTGAPWRDLPERFGRWNSVWKRFDRWASKGVWLRIFEELKDPDLEWLMLDSTVIRAHQHAAGAVKKGVPTKRWADPGVDSAPSCTSLSMASETPLNSS